MRMLSLSKGMVGLLCLIRFMPVVVWSLAAFGIGLGIVWGEVGVQAIRWSNLLMVIAGGILFQGVVAHALNEVTDGLSGTDHHSQGRLSGGARVIAKGYFTYRDLHLIAIGGLLGAWGITMFLVHRLGIWVWVIFAVGAWSSIAYSLAPLRLAYRPFLGEWLCAWPATWACVYGSALILGAQPSAYLLYAATIHGTISVAWLMQHHLGDVAADLSAFPAKITTVAWASAVWGKKAGTWLVAAYFLVAVLVSSTGKGWFSWWWLSAALGMGGFACALATDVDSISSITTWQLVMIALTVLNAIALGIGGALLR